MPKESPIQTSFNGGIFSPLLDGHIDAPRRNTSYVDSKNLIALKQGPLVRRGGTTNIFEALNPGGSNTKVELTTFLFNDEESYILQWSGDVIRFYTDDGIVLDSSTTQTITGITAASPPVVTVADTSTWTNGNRYVVTGCTEATDLNNLWYRIKNKSGTTAELYDFDDTTAWRAPDVAETSSTGSMSEIFSLVIPYSQSDLFDSNDIFTPDFVQSNDVMYISHGDFAPQVITRTADDVWTIANLTFKDGPYQKVNIVDAGVPSWATSSSSGGVSTLTITGATPFVATDSTGGSGTATEDDRQIALNFATEADPEWRYGTITGYTSTSVVEITSHADSAAFTDDVSNSGQYKLGAYSDTTGYPSVTSLHEGRLVFGATSNEPRRVDFSASSGFNATEADFTPHDDEGVVRPDDAISVTIAGGSANPIEWVESISQGLAVGTLAAEGLIRSSSNSESLTPENVSYKKSSTAGSASIQPIPIKNALIHVQFARRRLQELIYSFEVDGFSSFDMTELAEHLTRGNIKDIAYQQQPIETIWVLLSDGVLLGFTYERNSDVLGWHRHVLGGTDVQVKSIAVKPSESLNRDELWLAVARTIEGKADTFQTRTYVEKMERFYEDDIAREDIYHQDSGVQYSTTDIVITGMTKANPVVVTSAAHGRSDGDFVYFRGVTGMLDTEGNSMINGQVFVVDDATSTTMSLNHVATGNDVDGSAYSGAGTGGTLQQAVNLFQGLDFLEDESVEIYLDGNTTPDQTVTDGAITLPADTYGANVSIGLPSDWLFKSHRIEAGSANGTAQGKIGRINKVMVRLYKTLGFKFGDTEATAIYEDEFNNAAAVDNQTPLFTGDAELDWPGGYERDKQIVFKGDGPFPVQIQSIMPQISTSDKLG